MIRTEVRKVEEPLVGSNGAASDRGGKRTRGMTGKEHQKGEVMQQHVKKQHRRMDLSVRFNDQKSAQEGGGVSVRGGQVGGWIE